MKLLKAWTILCWCSPLVGIALPLFWDPGWHWLDLEEIGLHVPTVMLVFLLHAVSLTLVLRVLDRR